MSARRVGSVDELPPGRLIGVGRYVVGNRSGEYVASPVGAATLVRTRRGESSTRTVAWCVRGITRATTCAPGAWSEDHERSSRSCPDSGAPIDC